MSRRASSQIPLLPLVLLALVILALLPARFLRWTPLLADPVEAVIAPFAQLGSATAHWLRPASDPHANESELLAVLGQRVDKYEQLLREMKGRIDELTAERDGLLRARALNPEVLEEQYVEVVVIRGSSDTASSLIKVKGGRNRGIVVGAVAVYRGVHLVGRVSSVEALTSTVEPITDAGASYLNCVIMPPGDESLLAQGAACQLRPHPTQPNLLTGDVAKTANWLDDEMIDDLIVRLDDDHWPAGSQALVVGRVVRHFRDDAHPLRLRVDVRPVYQPLDRLPKLLLRFPVVRREDQ
ncbi:MAG: hypothetical protein KAS72_02320 [Phycisphaerales bacterium]|nr:hypothetical protein [Phycisphaerales bacterium]